MSSLVRGVAHLQDDCHSWSCVVFGTVLQKRLQHHLSSAFATPKDPPSQMRFDHQQYSSTTLGGSHDNGIQLSGKLEIDCCWHHINGHGHREDSTLLSSICILILDEIS